jgi:hypothetical protein
MQGARRLLYSQKKWSVHACKSAAGGALQSSNRLRLRQAQA